MTMDRQTLPIAQAKPGGVLAERELAAQRIAHLFRHCTRQGTINPLMHLVIRYREGATP